MGGNNLFGIRRPGVGQDRARLRCNFRNHLSTILGARDHAVEFSNGGKNDRRARL